MKSAGHVTQSVIDPRQLMGGLYASAAGNRGSETGAGSIPCPRTRVENRQNAPRRLALKNIVAAWGWIGN
jgi:hypothetical protein